MAGTIELPKQLWLEIVSYLDYSDLKACMAVLRLRSKAFKSYTEHPDCQKTMFRSKTVIPDGGTINLDDVRLHPAFESMSYECATKIEHVYFWTADGDGETVLTETCAAEEHATDPPVAFLRLQVTNWPAIQCTNKTGVTVVQVMKSLCRFFSKDDHRDSRGDHTGWTGWDETTLDRKGRLLLRVDWFDS
ncbi:hypothetical protein E4T39_05826 [Aureobasidium subglaciale]|nr:hypothetical protein E4T39_05826 [Aureobasidium subglaciale]